MAFTAFRTWSPGETVTAAMFNEQIRDNGNVIMAEISTDGELMTSRRLDTSISDASTSGTGKTALYTYTLAGGALVAVGDYLRLSCWGSCVDATNKTLYVSIGGVEYTFPIVGTAADWAFEALIVRSATGTAHIMGWRFSDNAAVRLNADVTGAIDFSADQTITVSATSATSGSVTKEGVLLEAVRG